MKKGTQDEYETVLSTKGQVVIVKEIRASLDLRPNQKLRERVEGGKIIIEPIPPLKMLKGTLKTLGDGKTTDELIKEIKEGWE